MKIAFLSSLGAESGWGGSEELWFRAARLALKCGHQVAVVVYHRPEIPPRIGELQEQGAWLLRPARPEAWARASSLRRRLMWRIERARVWGALASWEPSVVCISQGTTFEMLPHWTFTRFVNEYNGPYVVVCQHNYEHPCLASEGQRLTAINYFARAQRIAFVAERNLRVAERQLAAGLPNACVVRNPVNLTGFDLVSYPRSDAVKIAGVARLEAQFKSQDILLQALSSEHWKQRRWVLSLYGDGPDRPYLERLSQHYDIGDKVKFRGFVNDVQSIWAENQLLVMPSRSEGTPLALVEAMICGRPSVVTDVGGNLEWVDEPSTGFIAEAPSARSLGDALERAWEARDRWESIGQRAHQVAASRIDPHPDETLLSLLVQARGPKAPDPASPPKAISDR